MPLSLHCTTDVDARASLRHELEPRARAHARARPAPGADIRPIAASITAHQISGTDRQESESQSLLKTATKVLQFEQKTIKKVQCTLPDSNHGLSALQPITLPLHYSFQFDMKNSVPNAYSYSWARGKTAFHGPSSLPWASPAGGLHSSALSNFDSGQL